jgi:hypothetical protein
VKTISLSLPILTLATVTISPSLSPFGDASPVARLCVYHVMPSLTEC